MVNLRQGWGRDLLLRAAGLGLLACSWLLMRWLFRSSEVNYRHASTLVQMAAAAVGFVCFSAGATLASIGQHVFDQVEVSTRWARR